MVQSMLVKSMLAILKQSWFILTCQKGGVKKVTNRQSASPTTAGRQPTESFVDVVRRATQSVAASQRRDHCHTQSSASQQTVVNSLNSQSFIQSSSQTLSVNEFIIPLLNTPRQWPSIDRRVKVM
eukprot:Selendium_serpulae@DN4093_c0_g1_i2.p1